MDSPALQVLIDTVVLGVLELPWWLLFFHFDCSTKWLSANRWESFAKGGRKRPQHDVDVQRHREPRANNYVAERLHSGRSVGSQDQTSGNWLA